MAFRSTHPFDPSHPRALALYCSDGRFTEAVEELLRTEGHARLDTVTMPGGAALLNQARSGFADLDAVSRGLSFLIRGHAITNVFLIAHEGCGYYRARMSGALGSDITWRQRSDLEVAARAIGLANADVVVRSFFARVDGRHVLFEEVHRTGAGQPAP